MPGVFLTGASGFIGSRTARHLSDRGNSVTAALRAASSLELVPSTCKTVRVDFLDPNSIAQHLEGIEVIYHIAGATKAASQEEYDRANAATTRAILQARAKAAPGALFILVSTQAVCGPANRGPITPYGRSKLLAETITTGSDNWIIVRPPAVFGPGDRATASIFNLALKGLFFSPWVRKGKFAMVYIEDLARFLGMLPAVEQARGKVFLPAYERLISWTELYRALKKAAGRRIVHIRVPPPLVRAVGYGSEFVASMRGRCAAFDRHKSREYLCSDWRLDEGETMETTGWRPEVPLSEALIKTLDYYRRS